MRTILQHKYFSPLFIILVFAFSQSTFSQFEVNNAISELSVLQEKLNSTNINEPIIKDVRERSLSLRASALRCVDEIEPLVAYASHFHARSACCDFLQTTLANNTIDFVRVLGAMKECDYSGYVSLEYVRMEHALVPDVDNLSETILLRDFLEHEWNRSRG